MSSKNTHLPLPLQKASEISQLAGSAGLLLGAISFFGIGGTTIKSLVKQAKEIAIKAEELSQLPKEFQQRFQQFGWLLSESTSIDIAKDAIKLYDEDNFDQANDLLCTQFEGNHLDFLIMRLKHIPSFIPRYEIARTAVALTHAEQYIGAVPLILIVADGMASEAFGKSLFAEGIDVSEVKALAGSAEGLPQLISEVCKTRKPTNTEKLDFPFRNGIMHGKDVNFGNRLVTAKCWSILSCLADILRAKNIKQEAKDNRTFMEALKDLQSTKLMRKRIDQWQPRQNIVITGDGSYKEQSFQANTPEAILCSFFKHWQAGNYGKLGELTVYYDKRSLGKRAGQIRKELVGIELINSRLLKIKDEAAAVTEIQCELTYNMAGKELRDRLRFRMLYVDEDIDPIVRDEPEGMWQIIPSYQGWALGAQFPSIGD
ncbi:MAG: hypothetical protein VKJ04_05205 [Vampirovibrionales bacterium]|nr:hypothetical protein [Vampirovibrionales bacterium]